MPNPKIPIIRFMSAALDNKLKNLPQRCGVYIFKDDSGQIIYIGKAVNLKNRVRQYFQQSTRGESARRIQLRGNIRDLDYILVNSEVEAYILEANLIKRYRPPYNVRMKDDKRYPCIEITMGEKIPRMQIVRKTENRHSRYFGPYPSSLSMRRTFKLIQKAFMIRTCKHDLDIKKCQRPCLDYHINLCPGPCSGNISREGYLDMVRRACDFLDGHSEGILRAFRKDLEECSENLLFERCALIRDLISSIEHVTARRPIVLQQGDDVDFAGFAYNHNQVAVTILQVRDGKLLGTLQNIMEASPDSDPDELISRFFQLYYRPGFFIPPVVCVSIKPNNKEELQEWLTSLKGRKVELRLPERGKFREMVELAASNAGEYLQMHMKVSAERIEKNREALEDLKRIAGLDEIPHRIEGYDISNIQGKMAVASMVVFTDGEPNKDHYRRFKINTSGPDDFAMMGEALSRRFKNLSLKEAESFKEKPDLIMVDGGKGQLGAAIEAAENENITGIRIISLAKREEEIFVPEKSDPIVEDKRSPGLMLLQRVRDEAHRFAVTYHRKLRKRSMEVSILDGIPGISKKRKETLLRHFDSIEDLTRCTLYDLQELPGFNRKIAENVLRYLQEAQKDEDLR